MENIDLTLLERVKSEFIREAVVNLTEYFDKLVISQLSDAAASSARLFRKRRDFTSINGGGTPRNMFTVGKENLDKTSDSIGSFYRDPFVAKLLSAVAGEEVSMINYEPERYVVNILANERDTHGWHFDDYSYALVLIVHAPEPSAGGLLEYVPYSNDGTHRADYAGFDYILNTSKIHRQWYPSGTFYLMKSLDTLHRVGPIQAGFERMSLAMAYASPSDLDAEADKMNHQNIVDLYD